MKIIQLKVPVYAPCRCCGDQVDCSYMDWELRGLICTDCQKHLVTAEIQIGAWMDCEADAVTHWPALRPDGRYYNAPRSGRGNNGRLG